MTYNLYCSGEKLNDKPITTTNFFHTGASTNAEYTLKEVENGEETGVEYTTTAWDKNYIGFKVTEREGYNIDDGAVADLDGDGEYEILLRRVPSMDVNTRTSYPVIEAYKTDGTHTVSYTHLSQLIRHVSFLKARLTLHCGQLRGSRQAVDVKMGQ